MAPGRVYLIEDDASVRKALHRLIRIAGFHVESFADCAAFLASRAPSRPACLVLDIRMAVMTGLELRSAIAGTPHALPIVFITGHGDESVRTQALSDGAVDVLFKPIDEMALVAAIERALEL